MFDLQNIGRLLIICGILIAAVGGVLLLGGRIPWLGRLPGDFHLQRGNVSCIFPLATSLVLSIILTIVLNLLIRFLNR